MAITRRAEIPALRHRRVEGRHLVQRIRNQAEHGRALRPEDAAVPDLGIPSGGYIGRKMDVTPDGNPRRASEMSAARSRLERLRVDCTIVFMGSARTKSREQAEEALRKAEGGD